MKRAPPILEGHGERCRRYAGGLLVRKPLSEIERLKRRREAWRAVGPGYAEWLREAKPGVLQKLDEEIAALERGPDA